MPDAARVGDLHVCPAATPLAHVGGPVLPPASTNVETNSVGAARGADKLKCFGPVNFIVTGSATVEINGKPAARVGDKTMHPGPGQIVVGSSNVEIGGAPAGATLGNPTAGQAACVAARAGRNPPQGALDPNGNQLQPNTPGQSYNNCGVESVRQIINQVNPSSPVTQEGLLGQAMASGNANSVPGNLWASGGTYPAQKVNILNANLGPGSAAEAAPTMDNLTESVASGSGVTADVWAAKFWPASVLQGSGLVPGASAGGHTILVTGVEYDANGNLKNVIVNDTGTGQCSRSVPAASFQGALMGGGNSFVVTKKPIW